MKRSNQGSAHVVIIIIIVLALLATLGFVFWQNFINKPKTEAATKTTSSSTASTSETTPVTYLDAGVTSNFPTPLTWKVPESWSIDSTGSDPKSLDDSVVKTFTMTSPSGGYSVVYQIGLNNGAGGTCGPNTSTVEYISQKPIENLPQGRFVEAIDNNKPASGYRYLSGIDQNTQDVMGTKVGDSNCLIGVGLVTLSQQHTYTLLSANIIIKDLSDTSGSPKTIDSIETIKNAFNNKEYTEAVNMLLSTKLGN